MNTKRCTCVKKDWTTCSKYDNHHNLKSEHKKVGGGEERGGGNVNIYKHRNIHIDNG